MRYRLILRAIQAAAVLLGAATVAALLWASLNLAAMFAVFMLVAVAVSDHLRRIWSP